MSFLSQQIGNIDLRSADAYNRLFQFFTNQIELPVIFVPLKSSSMVYRSRPNKGKSDYWFFSDITYPPESEVKYYSRANKPHQQMFYASDNFATTLAELLPCWTKKYKVGDVFAVTTGQWEFTKDIWVAIIPDSVNQRLMQQLNAIDKPILTKQNMEHWASINTYFHAQGFLDNNLYKVSCAYCDSLFHAADMLGKTISGILYTSAQDVLGWNIVLTPQIAQKYLVLRSVVKHFIQQTQSTGVKPNFNNFITPALPISINNKIGFIKWNRYFAPFHLLRYLFQPPNHFKKSRRPITFSRSEK